MMPKLVWKPKNRPRLFVWQNVMTDCIGGGGLAVVIANSLDQAIDKILNQFDNDREIESLYYAGKIRSNEWEKLQEKIRGDTGYWKGQLPSYWKGQLPSSHFNEESYPNKKDSNGNIKDYKLYNQEVNNYLRKEFKELLMTSPCRVVELDGNTALYSAGHN